MTKIRKASHANSWYSADRETLNSQLGQWIDAVDLDGRKLPIRGARVIIAPHAGYSYSGPTAAWAYKALDLLTCKRVFILGPSHHVYLDGCALSCCTTYATPLGPLPLDTALLKELHATNIFTWMRLDVDEDEHSIEMHLPYVYKALQLAGRTEGEVKVVPIMVGNIGARKEKAYGEVLAKYLANPENVFVVSSDFCHWGDRFQYQHYYPTAPSSPSRGSDASTAATTKGAQPIWKSIECLDKQGMAAIESGSHDNFSSYLDRTKNTVCGRHPIGVVMAGIETIGEAEGGKRKFKFVKYDQSSHVLHTRDSSVSYASAYAEF